MGIAVNLLWCVPGEVGGSEEYLVRQLVGLSAMASDLADDTTLFTLPEFAGAHPELHGYRQQVARFDGASRQRRVLGEAGWLRQATAGASLTHHGGGTAPVGARQPYVLTVHDLQYRTFPQYFGKVKLSYLRVMVPRSVGAARVVTVPSQYVRATVIDAFHVPPERVMVVPHGVDLTVTTDVTPEADLRDHYGLGDGPFVIYPAVTHPHKNHELLLDLLAGPWRSRDLRIVLTGGRGAAEGAVSSCTDPRLIRLGRVPAADRNGLVAAARALLFPSTYEGFGAPLIEAMALGTPVVCADAASLPEVAGDAAVVRPATVDAWADVLEVVESDRLRLTSAGLQRVQQFTADASGAALAEAYRTALL